MRVVHTGRPSAGAARRIAMRTVVRVLLPLAAVAVLARPASAQFGAMIVNVRVEEEGVAVAAPDLLALIETGVGEPLSMADVRLSEDHLMALNRLQTVDVYWEPVDGGIRVTYRLVPAHPIDRIEFDGDLRLDADLLRREVRERFGTAPLPTGRVEDVVALLRQVYEDRGYPDVRIEAGEPIERHVPEHRAMLVMRIDAGVRAIVETIVWDDEPDDRPDAAVSRPDLREGRPYDRQAIRRVLDRWVDAMRERGHYEALAEDPVVAFGPDGAVVTVRVRRGPRVRVEFTGDPITRAEQERLVPVREEASVDEDLLENWSFAIENDLRARGYRDATAPHTSSPPGAAELTITFHVTKGPLYVIDEVRISGHEARAEADLREELGLEAGDPFVESALDAGAAAIGERYRTAGFTRVEVVPAAGLIEPEQADAATRRMQVVVTVTEGPRTTVRAIAFSGNTVLGDAQLRGLVPLRAGDPLSARALADSVAALVLEYRDRGYEGVDVAALIDRVDGDSGADITLAIVEGPQVFVDRIIIEGNERTSRETIARELVLQEGVPLGYTARLESQTRLSELGLFRRIRILDRPHAGDDRRDLVVQVEELPPTTVGYGGGLEISSRLRAAAGDGVAEERIEFVPRGFFEIGRRNMWGKNRSVNLFTRISARARDTLTGGELDTSYGVNEYRVYGTYREPRLFGSFANILVTAIAERAIRTSYSFVTREARAEMGGRLSPEYSGAVRFSVQRTRLFDVDPNLDPEERPLIDRLFPQVRLSKVSGTLIRNTRDDDLDPSRGVFVSADGELAARAAGSEVGYVKAFVQSSWYRQLPSTRRIVLAVRAILGAAHGFPREAPALAPDGTPILDEHGMTVVQIVQDLPASERFFAGGSTTHRGFSSDRLGDEHTISASGFPTGGNGEIILNSEVRVSLFRALAGVAFLDAGNVFERAADLSLTDLRPAVGFGFHYGSPVGPVRAEMGFNLDRRELAPGRLERGNVLHISLGPAF